MTPQILEEIFGKHKAKVYLYTGELLENQNPCEAITIKFATAINNYLIDSLVSPISGKWYLYTRNEHTMTEGPFQLVADLPLPETNENTGEGE